MISLPLFPLPLAVCPRELVPLHIFEKRYREMIHHCRDQQEQGKPGEFIITFYGSNGISRIGTVVRLVKVIKEYDDGRLDVIVLGRRRCQIEETATEYSYRCGIPEPVDDERSDWNETLATEAYNLHRALIQVVTGHPPDDELYAGVPQLSFLLASTISMTHEAKQKLLEQRSEDERLMLLVGEMSVLMNHVEQVQIAARAIQGNWELQKIYGHGSPAR